VYLSLRHIRFAHDEWCNEDRGVSRKLEDVFPLLLDDDADRSSEGAALVLIRTSALGEKPPNTSYSNPA
jgi:hypothetical protein